MADGTRMKMNHIRDVLAVAEAGSLRSAGKQLGVAQPALTRSIQEIERELGTLLFERSALGIKLTEAGRLFLRRAEAIQAEMRHAREEIDQLNQNMTGEVSIGMSGAACFVLLPAAMSKFQKRYPEAVLKVDETLVQPVERRLLDGRLDFWVGPADSSISSHLDVEELLSIKRVVVARKGHPLAAATCLADLNDADWIRPTLSPRSTAGDFTTIFLKHGLAQPRIKLHTRSASVTLMALINSDMLTIMPEQWRNAPDWENRITALPIEEDIPGWPLSIVRRINMPLTPLADSFCDMIRTAAMNYVRS
jgi:DNA-binding transcriptional LysR family regulator